MSREEAREAVEAAMADAFTAYGEDFSQRANRIEYIAKPLLDAALASGFVVLRLDA